MLGAIQARRGTAMKLGFVGLGRMGFNMVTRLARDGQQVVATTRDQEKVREISKEPNVSGAASVEEMVAQLEPPRAVWIMVTAGEPTDKMIHRVASLLQAGDCIVDAGNSNFRDSIRHGQELAPMGIDFMDEGTSGGIWGLRNGYCLMIGGERRAFERLEPAFKSLAPPEGYLLCGPVGAGHFVKMIHNGIEYGMMQAFGEGFEILEKSQFDIDLQKVAHLWNQASVVRSWLCELAELAFSRDPRLEMIRGYVEDSGEGRWTIQEAINLDVPAPIITLSLMERFHSRQKESFSAKVLAALRNEFGGHAVKAAMK
jgi:6-phosphogluconate dehydrogenase